MQVNMMSVTSLCVFGADCEELQSLLKTAVDRAKSGGRTFIPTRNFTLHIPSDPMVHIDICCSFSGISFYRIQHFKWAESATLNNTVSFPSTSFTRISEIPHLGLLFPSIGQGRFSRIVSINSLSPGYIPLVRELRGATCIQLLLGFFGKHLSSGIDASKRQQTREFMLRLGMEFLPFLHKTRMKRYTFLRTRFNLYPKPRRKAEEQTRKRARKPKPPAPTNNRKRRKPRSKG